MTKAEKDVRQYLSILDQIDKKLNMIRNELLPYYDNMTLKEVEDCLWDQYLKYSNEIHKIFKGL